MRDQVISAGNSLPPPSVRLTFQLPARVPAADEEGKAFLLQPATLPDAAVAQQLAFFGGGMSSANNRLKIIFLSKLSDIFV